MKLRRYIFFLCCVCPIISLTACAQSWGKFWTRDDVSAPEIGYSQSRLILRLNSVAAAVKPNAKGTIERCLSEPGLPSGLALDQTDCTISGTPTAKTPYANYVITARNAYGSSQATLPIAVTYFLGGNILGNPLDIKGQVSTPAGQPGASGSSDGFGSGALFNQPVAITTDGQFLFIGDGTNHTVRKMNISTGETLTFTGLAGVSGSTDAIGSAARFNSPNGITTDGTYLYTADFGTHIIRKIDMVSASVTTLAGSAGISGVANGTGATARFNQPSGITTDGTNLFIADRTNHAIRKIVISSGLVTTMAGLTGTSGTTDGIGTSARFNQPRAVALTENYLYVTDGGNHTIRRIDLSSAEVTTVAGAATVTGTTDGIGTNARFNVPIGVSTDGYHLFIGDRGNQTIRQIRLTDLNVTTIAGTAGASGTADGDALTTARFNQPHGNTTDGVSLYSVEFITHTVRRLQ